MISQYFIDIVPTEVDSFLSTINTFQYSVKENVRPIGKQLMQHSVCL